MNTITHLEIIHSWVVRREDNETVLTRGGSRRRAKGAMSPLYHNYRGSRAMCEVPMSEPAHRVKNPPFLGFGSPPHPKSWIRHWMVLERYLEPERPKSKMAAIFKMAAEIIWFVYFRCLSCYSSNSAERHRGPMKLTHMKINVISILFYMVQWGTIRYFSGNHALNYGIVVSVWQPSWIWRPSWIRRIGPK